MVVAIMSDQNDVCVSRNHLGGELALEFGRKTWICEVRVDVDHNRLAILANHTQPEAALPEPLKLVRGL